MSTKKSRARDVNYKNGLRIDQYSREAPDVTSRDGLGIARVQYCREDRDFYCTEERGKGFLQNTLG